MKELYLSRAIEFQPCFNRDVISELSDQATTSLLELGAWAEGERIPLDGPAAEYVFVGQPAASDEDKTAVQLLEAVNADQLGSLHHWAARSQSLPDAAAQITRVFLSVIADASDEALTVLLETGRVNLHAQDDINERNCLHEAAIAGRLLVLQAGLAAVVDVSRVDVYGRIPLHYACMHGRIDMVDALIGAGPSTLDAKDHDHFTPLIHATVHDQLTCVERLLSYHARINPSSESDHVPLNLSCQHGHVDIVRLLLENQAQILCDAEGLFPQHLVARSGRDPQLLLTLKGYGANLNELDRLNQWTPLFHAASEGHVACLRTLLDHGAQVDILDDEGRSALYYAAWEGHLRCMNLLSSAAGDGARRPTSLSSSTLPTIIPDEVGASMPSDADGIPDLILPPPFIPLRRYGHNFLDSKTLIQITFDGDAVIFFIGGRYPAARLAISSKSSDLIPRNVLLPIQEEARKLSFQIDPLDAFALDFDIFPTFGAKVIARTAALPSVFGDGRTDSGHCCLPLFDPRLRAVGQISLRFQVIRPFRGTALEITDFATYWKATAPFDSRPSSLVTESSLSGQYLRLHVQLTKDLEPVIHSHPSVRYGAVDLSVAQMTKAEFIEIGSTRGGDACDRPRILSTLATGDLASISRTLAESFGSLLDVLRHLPSGVHVDLHIMGPSTADGARRGSRTGTLPADLNGSVDAILSDVFAHSRELRQTSPDFMRSIVFSSYRSEICTALNWKQPNCGWAVMMMSSKHEPFRQRSTVWLTCTLRSGLPVQ